MSPSTSRKRACLVCLDYLDRGGGYANRANRAAFSQSAYSGCHPNTCLTCLYYFYYYNIFCSPPPLLNPCHRPDGPRFGPDGTLVISAFRADAKDTDKLLIFPPGGRPAYYIVTQVANETEGGPREPVQNTGQLSSTHYMKVVPYMRIWQMHWYEV